MCHLLAPTPAPNTSHPVPFLLIRVTASQRPAEAVPSHVGASQLKGSRVGRGRARSRRCSGHLGTQNQRRVLIKGLVKELRIRDGYGSEEK